MKTVRLAFQWIILAALLVAFSGCAPTSPVVTVQETEDPITPTHVILKESTAAPIPTATEPVLAPEPTWTPDPGVDDMPEYYGGLVVNMDYVGQTLNMRPKTGFLLRLGGDFDWAVRFEPGDVVTENRKVPLEEGEQGVFVARKRGFVTLTAVGTPTCLQAQPPCARPSVLYKMFILVD
jgi:hypothetical protein